MKIKLHSESFLASCRSSNYTRLCLLGLYTLLRRWWKKLLSLARFVEEKCVRKIKRNSELHFIEKMVKAIRKWRCWYTTERTKKSFTSWMMMRGKFSLVRLFYGVDIILIEFSAYNARVLVWFKRLMPVNSAF